MRLGQEAGSPDHRFEPRVLNELRRDGLILGAAEGAGGVHQQSSRAHLGRIVPKEFELVEHRTPLAVFYLEERGTAQDAAKPTPAFEIRPVSNKKD